MIKNHKQYRITCGQMTAIDQSINEYKKKVDADKDNLKLKTQLDVFNGQLYNIYQEIRAYEQRKDFRKHAKDGNDDKVAEMSFENPLLKNYLTKEQLIRFSNYYEEGMKKILFGLLDGANKTVKDLTAKLKETFDSLEKKQI